MEMIYKFNRPPEPGKNLTAEQAGDLYKIEKIIAGAVKSLKEKEENPNASERAKEEIEGFLDLILLMFHRKVNLFNTAGHKEKAEKILIKTQELTRIFSELESENEEEVSKDFIKKVREATENEE